ncbi:DoxX family membrane protein [Nocardia inohanensis]|uniref:DoxX family membrane protein n=1 Tax=Nocardia inohanensis TaxID=209246 RepID=UPI000830A484|nr:DoxX family membrane protein [Nocardia inohanensis]
MTEKPNEPSAGAAGDETPAPKPVGEPVRSPFDSPTEVFATASVKDEPTTPDLTKEVPRTDEELGLDPEVPLYSELKNSIPGAADSKATTPDPAAPTYAFASIPPAPTAPADSSRYRRDSRRGTLDLGLLLLRLIIGGTFIYHGLQKATGWFHGPGLDGIKTAMENGGWKHVDLSAPLLIAGELGGGILVVLGLATPLAAGAVLAVILDAWMWKQSMVPGFQYSAKGNSTEIESILAGIATVLILTGPGRLSFDRNRGWASRPYLGSLAALVAAIAAAILAYIYLHGGNPLTGIGPFD